jgi:hypothetical protein
MADAYSRKLACEQRLEVGRLLPRQQGVVCWRTVELAGVSGDPVRYVPRFVLFGPEAPDLGSVHRRSRFRPSRPLASLDVSRVWATTCWTPISSSEERKFHSSSKTSGVKVRLQLLEGVLECSCPPHDALLVVTNRCHHGASHRRRRNEGTSTGHTSCPGTHLQIRTDTSSAARPDLRSRANDELRQPIQHDEVNALVDHD